MEKQIILPQISMPEFVEQWNWAYYNWHGKFIACAKKAQTDSPEYDTFFIWYGPHCRYFETELVPRVTLVYGEKYHPKFISPEKFLEEFSFTNINPLNKREEPQNSSYMQALEIMKQHILQSVKK